MYKAVFKVRCWWNDEYSDTTYRYVVASSDEEVNEKMKKYAKYLKDNGFADLHWDNSSGYQVELDNVVID